MKMKVGEMSNYFRGKIKCLQCTKNYKMKNIRGRTHYCCSGSLNYGKDFCSYFAIAEEQLIYVLAQHFNVKIKGIESNPMEYVDRVKRVEVKGKDGGYVVYYNDGSKSVINSGEQYGTIVKY